MAARLVRTFALALIRTIVVAACASTPAEAPKERRVLSETKSGSEPFDTTYDPEGDRLLTTTNVDGM